MLVLCLLAVCVGAVLAMWMPVLHLALGLFISTLMGGSVAWAWGVQLWSVVVWSLALFVSAQVGYALGIAAIAALGFRRGKSKSEDVPRVSTFPYQ